MKSLKLVPNEIPESTKPTSTLDMVLYVANYSPPGQGFNAEEVGARLRIIDAVREAQARGADELLLEDADAAKLAKLAPVAQWTTVHACIPRFVEAVKNMPTVKPAIAS
jgi:hypothetical protein